jgi:hypothetical protein
LSEGGTALADGVVMRPGGRTRDDVVERRRGAVSAGSWYVRADNAIRMDGWCVYGRRRCRGMRFGSQTHASWLWRGGLQALGCRRRRRRGRRDGEVDIHTVQTTGRRVRLYTDGSSSGGGRGGSSQVCLEGARTGARQQSGRDAPTAREASAWPCEGFREQRSDLESTRLAASIADDDPLHAHLCTLWCAYAICCVSLPISHSPASLLYAHPRSSSKISISSLSIAPRKRL